MQFVGYLFYSCQQFSEEINQRKYIHAYSIQKCKYVYIFSGNVYTQNL